MNNLKYDYNEIYNKFFESVAPIKLTEAKQLKLNTDSWGLLTDYYLESVKINNESGNVNSSATLRIGDHCGQVICLVKGPSIGLLFGLSKQNWKELEKLCKLNGQLFYRYFKDGLNSNFSYENKLFYYFCVSSQKKDVLVAIFRKSVNTRKRDNKDAFLQVLELRKLNTTLLDTYQRQINKVLSLS